VTISNAGAISADGAIIAAGQLQLPTTGSSAGILIGGDTQLFRGAADRLDLASGDSFNIVSGDLSVNTSNLFVQQSTGNVGIGTITPGVALDVAGSARTNSNFYVNGGTTNLTSLSDVININKSLSANVTGSWSTGTAGGTARFGHTSVLYNGKVYSVGGFNGSTTLDTVDIYDIAGDSWSTGTSGGTARRNHTSVLYNGKIYSWGGNSAAPTAVDIYDIANDSWSTGTSGGTNRFNHTSVLYNGKMYIWGGHNSGGTLINTVDIYDIAGDSWSTGTAGGTARGNHTSVLYNGKIYSWGGYNSGRLTSVDIYDIANDSWSTGTSGGTGRDQHTSVLYNGKIYSWGGDTGPLNTVDIYDIANDSWSTGTIGGTARAQHTSAFYNGKIYSWGGVNSSVVAINTVDIYDIGFRQTILALQENGQDTLSFQAGSQLFLGSGRFGIMGGNVGIGTATPTSFKLQVAGGIGPDSAPTETSDSIASPDTTGDVGKFTSMALDASGFPVIAYADVTTPGLKIVHCGNANCTSGNSIAAPDADVSWRARNVSLKIDSSGNPAVAYRSADGNLKVLRCGNANCTSGNTITAITITGADLYTVALVLNSSGFPVMAYMSGVTQVLNILTCGNAACSSGNTTATPDGTVNTGSFADIKLDSSGFPVVSYRAVPSGSTLKLLHCGNATCTSGNSINTLDTTSDTAYWTSLVLDSSGFPVISYKYTSGGDLKIARCSDANCAGVTITTPDTTDAGSYTSIALNSSGFPVVAYYAESKLKVLRCGNANCTSGNNISVADGTADVGAYTAMVLDSAGFPVVSYQDVTNLNLKVVHCVSANCGVVGYSGGSSIGSPSAYFNEIYASTFYGKNTTISAFDLAENYNVTDSSIGAGDIVAIASSGGLVVEKTSRPYQANTMGIVSTQPGITLAEWTDKNDPSKRPIALAGRVPVKVSTENGPIKPGDAITSSSVPGVGMKATQPGHIVGIALTAYENEDPMAIGMVTVFVNTGYHMPNEFFDILQEEGIEEEDIPLVMMLMNALRGMVLEVRSVVADVFVGNKAQLNEIELRDKSNGEIYCIYMDDGSLISEFGVCGSGDDGGIVPTQELPTGDDSGSAPDEGVFEEDADGAGDPSSTTGEEPIQDASAPSDDSSGEEQPQEPSGEIGAQEEEQVLGEVDPSVDNL
jgi:hypothetical protein